jgi:hypothetical protein
MRRLVLTYLVLAIVLAAGDLPWETHGALRVADNGRYLEHADGTPFIWIGDTAWHLYTLNRSQIDQYFRDRASKAFNVVQIMAAKGNKSRRRFGYATRNGFRDVYFHMNTLGELPFESTAPPKLNEAYWSEIDYIVKTGARYGVYVCLATMWGHGAVEWFGDPHRDNYTYSRLLAKRYSHEPNVIWIAAGEFVKITGDWRGPISEEQKELLNRLGEGLRDGAESHQLIGMHGNQFRTAMPSTYFHNESWLDFHMNQSWDRFDFIEEMIETDRGLSPAKPTLLAEGKYEGSRFPSGPAAGSIANSWHMRMQAYWSVFFGGFGHTYGALNVWNCDGKLDRHALDLPGASQMSYLGRLLAPRFFKDRVRDDELVVSRRGTAKSLDLIITVRDSPGASALVYSSQGQTFSVELDRLTGNQLDARWYDPRLGVYRPIGLIDARGVREFDPPGEAGPDNDWILVLDRIGPETVPGREN